MIPFAKVRLWAWGIPIVSSQRARSPAKASPEYKPVRIPIRVIPICIVDKKRSGSLARRRAVFAVLLPFLAAVSKRLLRADTMAISDMDKMPFKKINPKIITISINNVLFCFKYNGISSTICFIDLFLDFFEGYYEVFSKGKRWDETEKLKQYTGIDLSVKKDWIDRVKEQILQTLRERRGLKVDLKATE